MVYSVPVQPIMNHNGIKMSKPIKMIEVKIRIPEDMHAVIKEMADKECRSMNRQVSYIVRNAIAVQSSK